MKRSKFINDVRHHIADTGEAEAIATLAEEAGLQWDPEEEEPEMFLAPPGNTTAFGTPLGIRDVNGSEIHVGDVLSFAEEEWGRPMHFQPYIEGGHIVYPGVPADWPSFCRVIKAWGDPEEPELPERLRLETIGTGTHDDPWLVIAVPETDSDGFHDQGEANAYVLEQVARYNFVSVLLEYYDLHKGMETSEGRLLRNFAGLLSQEREKLR
jgi:hypothetical protein